MKKIYNLTFLTLLLVFLGSGISAIANNDVEGTKVDYTVTFNVTDLAESPIPDAVITFDGVEYAEGEYAITIAEGDYNYSIERHGYVTYDGSVTVDMDKTEDVMLTPSVEMTFDGTTIDFSWNETIGTLDPTIIINMQPYNTDGAFVMLKLYNDSEELQIFADVFEEFSIGGLEYHSGTSNRIYADFTGAQSAGIWGTHAIDDNAAAGGSLRGTELNGALFYGVMVDGTVGTVGIVTPTATGSDQLEVAYTQKAGVSGSYHIVVEAYEPWRPGAVGSAGYYTLAELQALEPIAEFDYAFELDPIVINTQPASAIVCDYETTDLTIDAESFNGETLTYQWYYNTEVMTGEESATVTVSEAGEYYCMLTAGADELMSDIVTITVPEVNPVLEASYTGCDGTSIILDPGTFVDYDWSDLSEETTLEVTTDGTYSVTVADENGCTAMAETEVTFITEIAIPFEDTVYLCDGSTLILEAPESDTYEWSTEDETQTIEVDTEGWYYLTVTLATCSGNDSTYVMGADLPEEFDLGEDIFTCAVSQMLTAPDVEEVEYSWTTMETTETIEVTVDGTYGLTLINMYGCERYDELDVTFGTELVVELYESDTLHSCDNLTEILDAGVGTAWTWSTGDETQTIEAEDQEWYYVTVTNDYECEGIDSLYINFHSIPSINLGSDESSCADDPVELSAPSAAAWLWSTEETTQDIFVDESGEYICTISDGNGCQNSDTVEVTIYELPNVDLGDDIEVPNNVFFTIGVDAGEADYIWSNGETTSHQVIDASTLSLGNHTYSVTVTNIHGCVDDDDIVVTVTQGSAVNQNLAETISLTPNPTTGLFRVSGENINNIKVYDNIGKIVLTTKNNEIDITKYPAGMYFVKISAGDVVKTLKIVKQ